MGNGRVGDLAPPISLHPGFRLAEHEIVASNIFSPTLPHIFMKNGPLPLPFPFPTFPPRFDPFSHRDKPSFQKIIKTCSKYFKLGNYFWIFLQIIIRRCFQEVPCGCCCSKQKKCGGRGIEPDSLFCSSPLDPPPHSSRPSADMTVCELTPFRPPPSFFLPGDTDTFFTFPTPNPPSPEASRDKLTFFRQRFFSLTRKKAVWKMFFPSLSAPAIIP